MTKLPCIDCLTLAMCRSYYLQEIEKGEGNINNGYIRVRSKCSLLNKYFNISFENIYVFAYRSFITYMEEGKIYE